MGNEVAVIDRQQNAVPAFTMSDMERVALAIAKGGLFGSSDPNAVLTLCMLAQAEGQHPAVVFRDYHIIQGKPAKKAEAMQRDFLAAGGKIEWHKLDDNECSATFSHPQGGSATINWDSRRVQQAELGGNKMHKKYPRQMLRSRVISEGVRTVFPMATSGLYEASEVQDMVAQDGPKADTPATPEPKRARDLTPEPKAEEKAEDNPARAKAKTWAEEFIGKLADADLPETEALFAKSTNAIAKLEREHPDLHKQVMQYAPRSAEGNGDASGDTAASSRQADTQESGESDSSNGPAATTDASPSDDEEARDPAEEAAEKILQDFGKAETLIDLNKLKVEADKHVPFMPAAIAELIEGGYAKHKKRLTGAKAEPAGAK